MEYMVAYMLPFVLGVRLREQPCNRVLLRKCGVGACDSLPA